MTEPWFDDPQRQERRLALLTERLPRVLGDRVRWLRHPARRWLRIPTGALLVLGGIFSFLPVLGLWMLPLGLGLLADDVPLLRRHRDRVLDWIAKKRPHWFVPDNGAPSAADTEPAQSVPTPKTQKPLTGASTNDDGKKT